VIAKNVITIYNALCIGFFANTTSNAKNKVMNDNK